MERFLVEGWDEEILALKIITIISELNVRKFTEQRTWLKEKSQMLDKIRKFLRNGRRMKLTCAVFSKIERLGMRSTESYSNIIEFLAFCAQKFIFLSLKWIKFLVKTTCERFFFATLVYVDQHVSYTIYFWPEHRTKLTL